MNLRHSKMQAVSAIKNFVERSNPASRALAGLLQVRNRCFDVTAQELESIIN
jgi:hypothetical protein